MEIVHKKRDRKRKRKRKGGKATNEDENNRELVIKEQVIQKF